MSNDVPISSLELHVDFDSSEFDCGVKPLNKFAKKDLLKRSLDNKHKAFIATNGSTLAGYITFTVKQIEPASQHFAYKSVPVVMVEQIAVDKFYQGRAIARRLMAHAFIAASDVSKIVPLYGVALWAHKDATHFYLGLGFVILESHHSDPTTLMYLPMKDILAAFE
jgi:GNAT superfamily N-acetyltransferase